MTPSLTPLAIFRRFLRFGMLAWGGPFAQIAMIQRELVEEEEWISRERFGRVLGLYQMLPGPEAHELCVYFGMLAGGRMGGVAAGLGFLLPGLVLTLLSAALYVRFGGIAAAAPLFWGLQPVVTAMITRAIFRIGAHVHRRPLLLLLALLTFAGDLWGASFLVTLSACAVVGFTIHRSATLRAFALAAAIVLALVVPRVSSASDAAESATVSRPSLVAVATVGARAGLLTFGGAYTAVPIVREAAVVRGAWLSRQSFLDAIAVGGVLPAPMIIFTTFVAYVAAALPAALLMTFMVFLPAFAMTLFFHERLERIVDDGRIHDILDGVTAGVVGVIAATALRIGSETIRTPSQALLFAAAFVFLLLSRSRWSVALTVAAGALVGLLLHAT